jgi:SAM-dependent methyltransferase
VPRPLTIGSYADAFAVVAILGLFLTQYLFGFYREKATGLARIGSEWTKKWSFTIPEIGGFSYSRLALVSILGLFLELLMIRWVSSEIRIFSYFKNFVLIACFLGFGFGGYFCHRRINLLAMAYPLLFLAVIITLPWKPLIDTITNLPELIGPLTDVQVAALHRLPLDANTAVALVGAIVIIIPLFALIALNFIPIGQMIGWYLENAPRGITGYTVNIIGSIVGVLLYTLLCFYYQPPATWFAVGLVIAVALFWNSSRLRLTAFAVFLLCFGLSLTRSRDGSTVYWSPYQKLSITPVVSGNETISYLLNTNGTWFQQILNLSPDFVKSHPGTFPGQSVEWNSYNLPYHFYPSPASVLILGSGMGNDVAGALRNDASRVVAVEIDPLVVQLGKKLHFERPYQSPRVTIVIDDARSYIQNSNDRFNLIVFSLLDSHTTSSHFSNIRIDNYVYTREAFESARRLLTPDGIFVVKFWVPQPWIAGRLWELVQQVFGDPPVQVQTQLSDQITGYSAGGYFLIDGSQRTIQNAMAGSELSQYVHAHSQFHSQSVPITTDDWPYFYQREPGIPLSVLTVSLVLIVMWWWFLRMTSMGLSKLRWHFFFLGSGFMLLEAQIVSKMALLFGTTWVVNSIVISGLMVLIVIANYIVEGVPTISYKLAYAGIFLAIFIAYVVPLEALFFHSFLVKALVATLVLCLPVLFAGIVFIRSFAFAGFSGEAFGSNLFGALVGGVIESISYWTGIRSLLAFAAALYLASAFFLSSSPQSVSEPQSVPASD